MKICLWLGVLLSVARFLAAEQHPSLVGTWKLVAYEDWAADGSVARPFGDSPSGYLVYDNTGHMHVQVMRVPAMADFPGAGDGTGDPLMIQAAYQGYVAYYGSYTVDWQDSIVTHHVEGSLQPDYSGTDQPRTFHFEGEHFVIEERDPATASCGRREFIRAEPLAARSP